MQFTQEVVIPEVLCRTSLFSKTEAAPQPSTSNIFNPQVHQTFVRHPRGVLYQSD